MKIAEALSGHVKLEGIQRVLLSAVSRRALRDQLKALLSATAVLRTCRLRRARFKPGRKLTGHYDAFVHIEGTQGNCARPFAVTWSLCGGADGVPGGDDLAKLQAEALRRGVAAPFQQLMAGLPECGMQIQVSPLDARFPQLVRLLDPLYVRDVLVGRCAAPSVTSHQPDPGGYAVTSVRYHPGKRHVLRYDPLGTTKAGAVFVKLYNGEDGAGNFQVAGHVADWLAERGGGVTAVRPLAYVAEDGVVLYPRVVGAPLSEHLRRPSQSVARWLERTGAALHALHRLPQAVVGPLQPHDFAAEVKKAAGASDHIPALLPSVGEAFRALLDRAQELNERVPQEPPTFTHGDFKIEHLWATPYGPTLIDFDTRRLADPAFDVGRFLADLQLWHMTNDQPGVEQAQERFLAGYAPGAPEGRLIRARLYEAVQLVKIARRVRLSSPDWASRTKQVVRRAQAVMNDLEDKARLPEGKMPTRMLRTQRVLQEGSQP